MRGLDDDRGLTAIRQVSGPWRRHRSGDRHLRRAGLQKPDISILSDEFLAEVRGLPHHNLALELLRKLLNDEIKAWSRKNVVEARSFAGDAGEVDRAVPEPIARDRQGDRRSSSSWPREMRDAHQRGEDLGLSDDELAFYDALEVEQQRRQGPGRRALRKIARELVDAVRKA